MNSAAAPEKGGRFWLSGADSHRAVANGEGGSVWLLAAALVAAALAAYWASFSGPFLHDDAAGILRNATIRHFSSALFPPPGGLPVSGRPVLNLTFALNYAISGTAVWSYHALNLLVHVLAGLAIFGIARRTLSGVVPAFAIALLWVLHPLQTESVTYLSQRAESLMGLFYLLTLYFFIRGSQAENSTGTGRRTWWYALSILACLLGMGTKEVMVTAPVIVFLYDRAFASGSFAEAWRRRRGFYLWLASTWLFLACLVAGGFSRGGTAGFGTSVAWWAYAFTQFRAVAHYLRLCFWPAPLTIDYGLTLGGPPIAMVCDAALIIGLVAVSAVLLLRNSPLGFLGAWFFVILAPSSSVIPVATELIAEHRAYLSLAAVIAAAVCGVQAAWRALAPRWPAGRPAAVAAGLSALALAAGASGIATNRRNTVYRSTLALWTDAVAKMPGNAGARNNLGNALAEQGRFPEAIAQYREALRLVPDFDDPHYNMGNALAKTGHLQEAIEHYRAAVAVRPKDAAIRYALGEALRRLGRTGEAQGQYEEALAGASDSVEVWCGLGSAMLDGGRWPEAAKAYGMALQLNPDDTDALVNYAGALAQLGRNPEAIQAFQAALRLEPNAADVHNDLGGVLAQDGRLTEARDEFEDALRLKPDYPEARDNLEKINRMIGARPGR
ncbi:MAG: tetratricopeptide repeat protein [Opitutaceae bacterium]